MSPITVIADDLSGAAETAEQFRLRGHETVVSLGVPAGPAAAVTVVDVGTRSGTAEEARVAIDTLPLTVGALHRQRCGPRILPQAAQEARPASCSPVTVGG